MAFVEIEKDGDLGIGSAFHIGEGIFVTARHVLDQVSITQIRMTNQDLYYRSELYPKADANSYTIGPDSPKICEDYDGLLSLVEGPFFHPDEAVDLAAFRVSGIAQNAHYVPLGGHLDDWVGSGDFELSQVVVLGYPPVPMSVSPVLLVARGEVNASVDLMICGRMQLHFIISIMARGGFSGGLAMSEYGFALGVVTQSLIANGQPEQLGFFTTTAIEAVYDLLKANNILPECQKQGWDGLWDDEQRPRSAEG